ncbi:hypothetical protein [Rhizobium acidisoli]|nr:hypothetical protein [Rhizobium acidisoli]
MATVRNDLFLLDGRQFAALVFGVVGVIVILFAALIRTSLRLRRSAVALRSLSDDLAQVTQDLNVERLWRLAGGDGTERPSAESLKELYRILARHHDDASYMA